jgi:hypothetical protein
MMSGYLRVLPLLHSRFMSISGGAYVVFVGEQEELNLFHLREWAFSFRGSAGAAGAAEDSDARGHSAKVSHPHLPGPPQYHPNTRCSETSDFPIQHEF